MKKKHSNGYRHELKYYLNSGDYVLLSNLLKNTLKSDDNTNEKGEYFIRSLYFDDYEDSALRDKIDGVDHRYKVRIRTYNYSDAVIKLECKHKESGYIKKQSISLSRAECDALTGGDYRFLLYRKEAFAREMFTLFATRHLRPAVIVDYTREAYVFPVENVRITFDKNIRTGYRSFDIFDRELPTYPVADEYDMVLEVKFNEYLPTFVRSLIQTASHTRSAISKYVLSRKYEL